MTYHFRLTLASPSPRKRVLKQRSPDEQKLVDEDRAMMPKDMDAPISGAERAYWNERDGSGPCLELLGAMVQVCLKDGDERGARLLCTALGLDYEAIKREHDRR